MTPESRIIQVVFDTPLRRRFDYLPAAGGEVPRPGMRVLAPFGRQRAIGVVTGIAATSTLPQAQLKRLFATLDPEPLWDAATFGLLLWAADYYHHPPGEVFFGAMPKTLRDGAPSRRDEIRWRLAPQGREALAASPRLGVRQNELLRLIGDGDAAAETIPAAGLAGALKALARRGWLESVERPEAAPAAGAGRPGPVLTADQSRAVEAIGSALGEFSAWLLHGVTGSGKTEVYLRLIARVLESGHGALVLVPEIALTPQLVARFRERLPVPVVALHSSLADGARAAAWRAAAAGRAPVVIGTRSAIFTPVPELGLVVVDEEHDASYKQQEGFRYSARDLAVARSQRAGVPVVLGSATPSLESLANVAGGRYAKLSLPQRTGRAGKPRVAVIDLRLHAARDGLSPPAVAAIERHLATDGQVLVFLNRRGYAPTMFCPGCAWIAPCSACDARLTVHLRRARLLCHHCGADEDMPFACPRCGNELAPVGEGTERVETTLKQIFPAAALVRIDRDVIRRRGDMEEALASVADGRARILLGTQMLTKGHDFPDVTLVVVLAADQGLFGADFRASERLAQQIVQVAGRAGRGDRAGEVLIQTSHPEHPLLKCLITEGYEGFAADALDERRAAGWPPYSHLALLRADAPVRADVHAFLHAALAAAPARRGPGLRLLGPAPASMEKRAGRHRAQLLVESPGRTPLQKFLAAWLPAVAGLRAPRALRWSLDVDPIEVD
ncbi:MAG TPA: primosomal protein N' [Steroidobacteraceae bacterium]|nr:primosomal protein N' [Steroidobacteraceae bacterium]